MGEGQLTCGGDEVERGGKEAPERPGSRVCDQVGNKRGRTDCQADGEQMQAAPDHGASRLGCQSLRDPAEGKAANECVRHDRASQKQKRIGR
jgi:hypothetical protein